MLRERRGERKSRKSGIFLPFSVERANIEMGANEEVYKSVENPEMDKVADFHIKSKEGDIFFCSKALFHVKSDYFKTLFSGNWESGTEKIWESGLPSSIIRSIVRWVYLEEI